MQVNLTKEDLARLIVGLGEPCDEVIETNEFYQINGEVDELYGLVYVYIWHNDWYAKYTESELWQHYLNLGGNYK